MKQDKGKDIRNTKNKQHTKTNTTHIQSKCKINKT